MTLIWRMTCAASVALGALVVSACGPMTAMGAGSARVEPVTVAVLTEDAYVTQNDGRGAPEEAAKMPVGNDRTGQSTGQKTATRKTGVQASSGTGGQQTVKNGCSELRLPLRAGGWKKKLRADYRPGAINLGCYKFLDNPSPTDKTAYALAVSKPEYRNRLAEILIKQSDDICTSEKGLLLKHQAEVNAWSSSLTSVLAGASTVVTGELAKSILSAGAGFSNSARDHINTHVYRNQIIQTITRAIDSERKTLRSALMLRLAEPPSTYSADAMIRDVNEYHQACSMEHGLQVVMEAVEKREDYVEQQKREVISSEITSLLYGPEKDLPGSKELATQLLKQRVKSRTGMDVSGTAGQTDPGTAGTEATNGQETPEEGASAAQQGEEVAQPTE